MEAYSRIVNEVERRSAYCNVCLENKGGCVNCIKSPKAFIQSLEQYRQNEYSAYKSMMLLACGSRKVAGALYIRGVM